MTFKFGPLALLNFSLFPFLFCGRFGRRLNRVLELLNYTIALILLSAIYIIFDTFYYFVALWNICTEKEMRKSSCKIFKKFAITILGFPLILGADLSKFVKDAFTDHSSKQLELDPKFELTPLRSHEV